MLEHLEQWQLAYLAGLIDGEGSLESQKEQQPKGVTSRYVLRLSFCFATPEPLETISKWLDIPVRMYPSTDPTRSPRRRAQVTQGKAAPLLRLVLPFLILKREQAELVLAIDDVRRTNSPSRKIAPGARRRMPAEAVAQMDALHQRLRATKSNKRRMDARVNRAA